MAMILGGMAMEHTPDPAGGRTLAVNPSRKSPAVSPLARSASRRPPRSAAMRRRRPASPPSGRFVRWPRYGWPLRGAFVKNEDDFTGIAGVHHMSDRQNSPASARGAVADQPEEALGNLKAHAGLYF